MSVYLITYHMQPHTHHHHSDSENECSCDDTHHHEHGDNCGCGGDPDYDLVLEIETLGRWAQFMPTSYLVQTDISSKEILDRLEKHVGSRDLLFVTKVDSKDVASLTPQVEDWITKNS